MKKTLFLVFSGAIVIFTIISICCAPIINGDIINADSWKTNNCKLLEDAYKLDKKNDNKKAKNLCNRQKAMYELEYSSLTIDVILGFICTILSLLHYFDIAKPFEKISALIGFGTGIVGSIITIVYICYSGYILTNDTTDGFDDTYKFFPAGRTSNIPGPLIKLDKDGAFAEWDDSAGQYRCMFFKKDEVGSTHATYSELGKKQYNYEKKRNFDKDAKYTNCEGNYYDLCVGANEFILNTVAGKSGSDCKYLYLDRTAQGVENKYVFDRWISTIIFSCLIVVCCIFLAIFGLLLFISNGSGL